MRATKNPISDKEYIQLIVDGGKANEEIYFYNPFYYSVEEVEDYAKIKYKNRDILVFQECYN